MATPTRRALLSEIEDFAKGIQNASTWLGTKKPFGHIVNTTKENYIYEFWCYLKILSEINKQPNQKVKLIKASGKFPTSPASKKKNWSYYEVNDSVGKCLYLACAGTGIKRPDAITTIHHPDISFQKPTADRTDDPSGEDVVIVLDAKYVYPTKKDGTAKDVGKLSLKLLSEFAHIVEVLLRTDKSKVTSLSFGDLSDINANALLSNAEVQIKHKDACIADFIKQVGEFEVNKLSFTVIP